MKYIKCFDKDKAIELEKHYQLVYSDGNVFYFELDDKVVDLEKLAFDESKMIFTNELKINLHG